MQTRRGRDELFTFRVEDVWVRSPLIDRSPPASLLNVQNIGNFVSLVNKAAGRRPSRLQSISRQTAERGHATPPTRCGAVMSLIDHRLGAALCPLKLILRAHPSLSSLLTHSSLTSVVNSSPLMTTLIGAQRGLHFPALP